MAHGWPLGNLMEEIKVYNLQDGAAGFPSVGVRTRGRVASSPSAIYRTSWDLTDVDVAAGKRSSAGPRNYAGLIREAA